MLILGGNCYEILSQEKQEPQQLQVSRMIGLRLKCIRKMQTRERKLWTD